MTKNDMLRLHPVHSWHQRYICLTDDLPVLDALENHRLLFTPDERTGLEQLSVKDIFPCFNNQKHSIQLNPKS